MQTIKAGLWSTLFAVLMLLAGACRAETIVIDHESPVGFWFVDDERFVDPTNALTAEQVAALKDQFRADNDQPGGGKESGAHWGRFTVQNDRTRSVELVLIVIGRRSCTLHQLDASNRIESSLTGGPTGFNHFARVPLDEGSVEKTASRYTTFTVPAKTTQSFLTRCEGNHHTAEVSIFEFGPYLEANRLLLYLEGLLIGTTLSMAIVSIFSAATNRDRSTLLYSIWLTLIVGVILTQSIGGSRLEEFLFDDPLDGVGRSTSAQYLYDWSCLVFLGFCYVSLDLRSNLAGQKKAQHLTLKVIQWCLAAYTVVMIMTLLLWAIRSILVALGMNTEDPVGLAEVLWDSVQADGWIGEAAPWVFVLDLFLRLAMLLVAIWIYVQGQKSSRYIVAALVLYFISSPGLVLARNLIPAVASLELGFWHFPLAIDGVYCLIAFVMSFAITVRSKEIKNALDEQVRTRQAFMEEQNLVLEQRVKERTHELMLQTEKTERLMLNILPAPIAERLKRGEPGISDSHASVTILFSDLVGFTALSSKRSADEVVKLLNDLFSRFDIRAKALGLEKIKTIGDAYMVAGGIPQADDRHAERVTQMALGMREDLRSFNADNGTDIAMRIGINSGSVIAGVIGHTKFSYDLWGNTVNAASRMESTCEVGQIQVSASTFELIRNLFVTRERGFVECKGLGQVRTFFVDRQSQPDQPHAGLSPIAD